MAQGEAIGRIGERERIASLDILRGIAILLILFMNIPWMGGYGGPPVWDFRHPTWTEADRWTSLVIETGFGGTQRGLLELLFGAGIMIMARGAMTPDGPVAVADLHYRRNLWLIVFGLVNALVLIWPGDILLTYGIAAIFLFPFRRMGPRGQLGFAGLLLAALLLFSVTGHREAVGERARVSALAERAAGGATLSAEDRAAVEKQAANDRRRSQLPSQNAEKSATIAEVDAARRSSFASYWESNTESWLFLMQNFFFLIEAEIMATMLIGMALYRWGVIQGRARRRVYVALAVLGYGFGLTLRYALWSGRLSGAPGPMWQGQFEDLARLAVTFGHLGLVHLVLGTAAGRRLLSPFAAAGRMPLTVYLFTSFLMMWVIFAPWGFGMFGRWGMAQMALVAAIVCALELVAVNLMARRLVNGPMEWLWKSLAYEQRQPFLRPRGSSGAVQAPAE